MDYQKEFMKWCTHLASLAYVGQIVHLQELSASQEVLCDQIGAAVFNSKLSGRLPKIPRAQVESRFADLACHTDFTSLDQIRKVLYAASV